MFPLLCEPVAKLTEKQVALMPDGFDAYMGSYQPPKEHVELILFTVQTLILQNDRFSAPGGDALVDRLGIAAKHFSAAIHLVAKLIEVDRTWYQPWLSRIAPELANHAKSAQILYMHLSHLAEPPLHMGGWSIYAIAKSVEAALGLSAPPHSWASIDSLPAESDELLIVEFMSQLVLRFLEYHRKDNPG